MFTRMANAIATRSYAMPRFLLAAFLLAAALPASELRHELGDKEFEKLPTGAIGLYTYYERLAQGLRQLMAGSRKFALKYMSRNDLAALTPDAARISGIQYIMDVDKDEADKILNY